MTEAQNLVGSSPLLARSSSHRHSRKLDPQKQAEKRGFPKQQAIIRFPSYWRTSETTTAIQVHSAADAQIVRKQLEGRRIAYAVAGDRLEVFEVRRVLDHGDGWITKLFPGAKRVWGCDLDDRAPVLKQQSLIA